MGNKQAVQCAVDDKTLRAVIRLCGVEIAAKLMYRVR